MPILVYTYPVEVRKSSIYMGISPMLGGGLLCFLKAMHSKARLKVLPSISYFPFKLGVRSFFGREGWQKSGAEGSEKPSCTHVDIGKKGGDTYVKSPTKSIG